MGVFFMPLAVVSLGAIVYVALSKKTGPRTRIAALVALGVMILSVIVCLVIIFGGAAVVGGDTVTPLDLPAEKAAPPGNDLWVLLAFVIFLIVLFVVVAILSLREQRRAKNAKQGAGPRAA
jgi:TRAP-type C4-dicarboxylate transport system permease small subunit